MIATLDQLILELFVDEPGPIADDTRFADCSGWDSLKHVELIVAIERRFGVELSAEEIGRLTCKRAAREILADRSVDV
jgi:acyl carrier protein